MTGIFLPVVTTITVALSGGADSAKTVGVHGADSGKADTAQTVQVADTVQAKPRLVGSYPNHTNYSVHLNPALQHSSQYGQWAWIALGRTENGGRNAHAMVNKTVFGDVTFTFWYVNKTDTKTGGSSNTTNIGISFPAANGILLGGNLATTRTSDGKESSGFSFGLVGLSHTQRFLMRLGAMYDNSERVDLAGELRARIGSCEAGFSGKVVLKENEGPVKGLGVQFRKGKNVFNLGRGGPDWRDTKLHWRHVLDKKTMIDVHFSGKGSRVVRKPGAVLVGVTRMF